jgi:hypothetical protein
VGGVATLPAALPAGRAARIVIEVRDVSVADAPSLVVADQILTDVALLPGGRIRFHFSVPAPVPGQQLSLRVHVDRHGAGRVSTGDLLSTQAHPVTDSRQAAALIVPLTIV